MDALPVGAGTELAAMNALPVRAGRRADEGRGRAAPAGGSSQGRRVPSGVPKRV